MSEVICLFCPAIQKAGQKSDMNLNRSARPFHKFIPMDCSTELRLPSGAVYHQLYVNHISVTQQEQLQQECVDTVTCAAGVQ